MWLSDACNQPKDTDITFYAYDVPKFKLYFDDIF